MKRVILAVIILLTLVLGSFAIQNKNAVAADREASLASEENILCEATLQDDFAEDRVLVVLNKTATQSFKTYAADTFPEIACTQVTDATESTAEMVKMQLIAEKTTGIKSFEKTSERGMSIDTENFRSILQLDLAEKSKSNVLETIKLLEKRQDILYAGPDYVMEFFAAPSPSPTYYSNQIDVFNNIQLEQAWDITTGSSSVTVGVMDSGIESNLLDLTDRIDRARCGVFTNGTSVTTAPTDSNSGFHGTLVAGVIGAQRNIGKPSITGVCQQVQLASLEISDPDEGTDYPAVAQAFVSSAIRALNFATYKSIPIVNLSAGYTLSKAPKVSYDAMKAAIIDYTGLLVCAAGNTGQDNDTDPVYPSNYRLPNLISVGASNVNNNRWLKSNYGTASVDLFAPGVGITSIKPGTVITDLEGTSMAAPFVTGVAALIKSKYPDMTPGAIKDAILNNVDKDPANSLYDKCVSQGRLNAYKALLNAPLSFTVTAQDRYNERFVNLSQHELREYEIKFETGGPKMFRALARYQTGLILYDANHNELVSAVGDMGNLKNAFISYNIAANTKYYLHISFRFGAYESGTIKLITTPAAGVSAWGDSAPAGYDDIINIELPESGSIALNGSTVQSSTAIYRVTAPETGTYTFETVDMGRNMCLYLIDPFNVGYPDTRPFAPLITTKDYDLGSGSSGQAVLTKRILQGETLFLLISTYNPSVQYGAFSVDIRSHTLDITYLDQGGLEFSGIHGNGYRTTHTYGTATPLIAPTKAGYTFGGWYAEENCTDAALTSLSAAGYTDNITLYAKWTQATYNITYNNLNGATNSNPAIYTIETATITLSAPGSRAGYTFAGWYDNAQFTGTAVTEIPQGSSGNKGLFAKWVVNTLNITYSGGGGTGPAPSSPSSSQYGGSITMPANTYSRTGYTFAGWSVTGAGSISGTYQAGANVSVTALSSGINSGNASITLTAVWTPLTYTLTYTLNGGSFSATPPATFTVEDLPFALPAPERNGYTFAGWYENENFTGTAVTQVTAIGNKAFYAKWTQVTYTLTYTPNGGSFSTTPPATFTVEDLPFALPAPERNGYTFAGWYENAGFTGAAVTQVTTIGNKAFYVKWTQVAYSITYNNLYSATNNNPLSYTIETQTITLSAPGSRVGYSFAGWYDNGFTGSLVTEIQQGILGNKNLFAKWTAVTYTITYNLNGGTFFTEPVTSFTAETMPLTLTVPARIGFIFAGWYGNSGLTGEAADSIAEAGDLEYWAKWITAETVQEGFREYYLGGVTGEVCWTVYSDNTAVIEGGIYAEDGYAWWFFDFTFTGFDIISVSDSECKVSMVNGCTLLFESSGVSFVIRLTGVILVPDAELIEEDSETSSSFGGYRWKLYSDGTVFIDCYLEGRTLYEISGFTFEGCELLWTSDTDCVISTENGAITITAPDDTPVKCVIKLTGVPIY